MTRFISSFILSSIVCATSSFGATAPKEKLSVTDATSVSVVVDGVVYQCTGGAPVGGDILVSGSYKNLAGNALCPQAIRATITNGVMDKLTVTFLEACNNGSVEMTCSAGVCQGGGSTITVIARDQYYFVNSDNLGARFALN